VIEQTKGKKDVVIKAAVEVKGSDIFVDLTALRPRWIGGQRGLQFYLCLRLHGDEEHVRSGYSEQ